MNVSEKIKSFERSDIKAFAFAFTLFLMTPPYFIWNKLSPLIFIAFCILLSFRYIKFNAIPKVIFAFFLLLFYVFVGFKEASNLFGYFSLIGIVSFTLLEDEFLKKVFKNYIFIFSVTMIPSIVSYLLVNIFDVNLPNEIIKPLNQFKANDYILYPFYVQQNTFIDLILPRFYAYYDEPGVVGTISGVLLMVNGFDLRKKINIPILIAGLLSFSFAFYIMMLGYFFVFVKTKYKVIGAIVIISLLPIISSNELLNSYIFSRFEINENGSFTGDNRIVNRNFEGFYDRYSKSDDFYFGLEKKASLKYNFGGASYKDLIVNYGIIPFGTFILLFILYAYNKLQFRKEFFVYLFVLWSIIYQRPFITDYYYVFLIFMPIIFLSKKALVRKKVES